MAHPPAMAVTDELASTPDVSILTQLVSTVVFVSAGSNTSRIETAYSKASMASVE